ncbi:hypothetical protein ACX0GZ_01405 [Sphingomonas aestuarii]
MNLLLILLAMLSGLPGAMAGARGVQATEVQQSQSVIEAAVQRAAAAVVIGHRVLANPLPSLAQMSLAAPLVAIAPTLPVRSIVESALE